MKNETDDVIGGLNLRMGFISVIVQTWNVTLFFTKRFVVYIIVKGKIFIFVKKFSISFNSVEWCIYFGSVRPGFGIEVKVVRDIKI